MPLSSQKSSTSPGSSPITSIAYMPGLHPPVTNEALFLNGVEGTGNGPVRTDWDHSSGHRGYKGLFLHNNI